MTDDRGQNTDDRRQMTEFGIRPPARRGLRGLRPGGKADPPSSDKAGLWRGEDGEGGKYQSILYALPYTLYLRSYALRLMPCALSPMPYALCSTPFFPQPVIRNPLDPLYFH